ncbi:PREDICTED: uncharacterized protein LOC109590048 [Amphimedon queenslandica]|uniref:Fibrinogen C-terminal domain-containing protein n=3 Tax=Amphimedon queenslandica TaxID=400682 RepID=A0AAN0JWW1_AMPQE|nr:PREDICTED: uncharacterized protein LOC109590048 [Amphimedon queenslandica]|eukprot:XP_019861578.1 PREDICTED: uncharacterized protein LOC109590048 [Amphimedon queenslandica]
MENKTMLTTSSEADNEMKLKQNVAYQPVVKSNEDPMYSYLNDYSDYQLPKAIVKATNKFPQQPVQYAVGKKSFVAIIFLLLIIIFLLVALLVLDLVSKDIFVTTSPSNSSKNGGSTNIANTSGQTAINSNLSLIWNKIDNLLELCDTTNISTRLNNVEEKIIDHNANSNLSMIEDTMNQNFLLLQNLINNISFTFQNRIDNLTEQIELNNVNTNSNLSLIQNTLNHIIHQIMIHANNTNSSVDELLQFLNTSLINDISIPAATALNSILLTVNEILDIQNGSSQAVSCKDIKTAQPCSSSGYYHVNDRNIYCNMGELCGQEGGWTRIAYLNANGSCPSGFEALVNGEIRVCRREGNSAGCRSNIFQMHGISYSQICGKVVGYQKGTTDGVNTHINDINSAYIDGVSITRGSPRQHVWSYIAGFSANYHLSACPCNTGASNTVQSFVGNHSYCESGTTGTPNWQFFSTADPLWDGNNCPQNEAPCCTNPSLPWFFRDYDNATITDYIELRVCANDGYGGEDIPLQSYEIYVK